jgi:CRISPR-associated endonuclease/helicase Cas3
LIAVTTQVAEMSLDLDADILISEIAPVPSIIQRLGRLNRFISVETPGTPRTAYFIWLEKDKFLPYKESEIEHGKIWLEELINLNRPISQFDLAEYFQKLPVEDEGKLNLFTNWLDSGWFAMPESVRDPNVSVSVILPEDENVCQQDRRQIINKSIPMTYKKQMENWRELKGNLIAPPNTIAYCKQRGAKWL